MTVPSKFHLLLVGTVLALLISCSDESPRFPTEAMYSNYSSSSTGGSSSSETSSSSEGSSSSSLDISSSSGGTSASSTACGNKTFDLEYQFCDIRDFKIYNFVTINEQVWMAENLKYNVPDNDTAACYENENDNCDIYGRLYDWATAMALSSDCNSSSCSTDITEKHKGICPSNWHLPSEDEWTNLKTFANLNCDNNACAGTLLKSGTLWNAPNGSDKYGFAALPDGYGYPNGGNYIFSNKGNSGNWWSVDETGESVAWTLTMFNEQEDVYDYASNPKDYLLSVRCIRDN